MSAEDAVARHRELVRGFAAIADAMPEVASGFDDLHGAALRDGALSKRTKELMALAISIAVRCDGCIAFHLHDALRAGATRAEIEETIGVAVLMGGGPSMVYGADAHRALAQFEARRND
jgi:AhpD family alkylhydroperoxidase